MHVHNLLVGCISPRVCRRYHVIVDFLADLVFHRFRAWEPSSWSPAMGTGWEQRQLDAQ